MASSSQVDQAELPVDESFPRYASEIVKTMQDRDQILFPGTSTDMAVDGDARISKLVITKVMRFTLVNPGPLSVNFLHHVTWDSFCTANVTKMLAILSLAAASAPDLYPAKGRLLKQTDQLSRRVFDIVRCIISALLQVAGGASPLIPAVVSSLDTLQTLLREDLAEPLRHAEKLKAGSACSFSINGLLQVLADVLEELNSLLDGETSLSCRGQSGIEVHSMSHRHTSMLLVPLCHASAAIADASSWAKSTLDAAVHTPLSTAVASSLRGTMSLVMDASRSMMVALNAVLRLPDSSLCVPDAVNEHVMTLMEFTSILTELIEVASPETDTRSCRTATLAIAGVLPQLADCATRLATALATPDAVYTTFVASAESAVSSSAATTGRALDGASMSSALCVSGTVSEMSSMYTRASVADSVSSGAVASLAVANVAGVDNTTDASAAATAGSSAAAAVSINCTPLDMATTHAFEGATAPLVVATITSISAASAVTLPPSPLMPRQQGGSIGPQLLPQTRSAGALAAAHRSDASEAAMRGETELNDEPMTLEQVANSVRRSWLPTPATVFWLDAFGHPLSTSLLTRTTTHAPSPAAMRGPGPPPAAGGACDGDPTPEEPDEDTTCTNISLSAAYVTTVRPSSVGDGGRGSSHDCARDPPCAAAFAAVQADDFDRRIKSCIQGVGPALDLARRYHAYTVNASLLTDGSAAVEATAARLAQRNGPFRADLGPGQSNTAPSCSSSGAFRSSTGSSRGSETSGSKVVSLTLFDRFVQVCAEPSAQAAFQLQAGFAIEAATEAAFSVQASGMGQHELRDALRCGRLAASIACAAAAALLPFAKAVVASAYSCYAHGGCAGAWAGFLPRQQAEDMLRAQAVREGGPGAFLLRLSSSRACEMAISYAARVGGSHSGGGGAVSTETRVGGDGAAATCSGDGGIRIVHEILQLSLSGNGVVLRGEEYDGPGHAVCALRDVLKTPCLAASLAVVGWAMPANAPVGGSQPLPAPNALSSFDDLVSQTEARASPLYGTGLVFLAHALYGSSLAHVSAAAPLGQLFFACDTAQAPSTRFVLPSGAYERTRRAADHAVRVTHALPGVSSPEALAATAWAGPLPVPAPSVLPTAVQYSSSSKNTPRRYAFAGFHAALVYEDTLARLKDKPPGSYLLRASQSQRSSAVLAFVDASGKVQQSIISPDTSSAGTGKVICSGNTFPSLLSVLLAYSIPPAAGATALLKAAVPPASSDVRIAPLRSGSSAAIDGMLASPACFELRVPSR